IVVAWNEMRRMSARSFEHLMLIKRQEFFVRFGPPWEGIDAVKSLGVIDPEEMKHSSGTADTLSPPLEIVGAHGAPAVERNAPVLSPFLCERVVLEVWLWRRAAEPIEQKFIGARENIGAVITDAEWNIAHQRDAALLRMRFDVAPLLLCDPLHVTEKIQTARHGRLFLLR